MTFALKLRVFALVFEFGLVQFSLRLFQIPVASTVTYPERPLCTRVASLVTGSRFQSSKLKVAGSIPVRVTNLCLAPSKSNPTQIFSILYTGALPVIYPLSWSMQGRSLLAIR